MVQQRQSPAPFEQPLGSEIVCRLASELRFRVENVERDESSAPSSLDGALSVMMLRQIMAARSHQERAKSTLGRFQP
jgi:hypothetical protein